jgi:hypothetical protein
MSTDTDDKAQSKFPRASLRASKKTLMITPADVADFQVRADTHEDAFVDVADVFEDSLSSLGGVTEETPNIPAEKTSYQDSQSTEIFEDQPEVVEALSDVWESDPEEDDNIVAQESEAVTASQSSLDSLSGDIFAAPAEAKQIAEDIFSPIIKSVSVPESAKSIDPIVRETRPGPVLKSDSARGEEYIDWKKHSKLIGFLVSYSSDSMGSYVELREGRLLVTSGESSSDSCLVIPHESVSPMHAIMRIAADGTILILDQLSEHGTRIKRAESGREESLMGDKSALCHGDVVIFGECEYHLVVMGAKALTRDV